MQDQRAVLSILTTQDDPSADAALLAALPRTAHPTAGAIVEALIVRNRPPGLLGLVAVFHHLDEPLRQVVLGEIDRIFGVLRQAAGSADEQVRLNALEVIRRGRAYRAAYLVDAGLHDRSPRVREAAVDTLYTLADTLLATDPVPAEFRGQRALTTDQARLVMADLESHREDRRQLLGAIEAGLVLFSLHLQPKAVEAAMWLVDDLGPRFWAIISAPRSRAGQAAVRILLESRDPRLAPFAMMALNYSELRPHIVELLATKKGPAFLASWFGESWRIAQPKIARGMLAIREVAFPAGGLEEWLHAPGDGWRHIPRCLASTGLSPQAKLELLREIVRRGDRPAKRSAMLALTRLPDQRATSLLQVFAGDDDPDLACIARHELGCRRPPEYPPAELLQAARTGGHPLPQADSPAGRTAFEQYWTQFDRLCDEDRVTLGREVLAGSPTARIALARRLMGADVVDRVRSLRIVTVLDMAKEFGDQIYKLSHDPSPEVRSAAMSALGRLPDPTSRRILHTALLDGDVRVQANAVEAIDLSTSPAAPTALLPMLSSPDNRVRANAVKALLQLGVREAAQTLLIMLDDGHRAHRISALWLIERLDLFSLAARVVKLADTDEDDQVRRRAAALRDRLLLSRNPAAQAGDLKEATPWPG